MTEFITSAGVTAVVIILTTLLLLVISATKVFSRRRSRDSINGGGVVPNVIPDASSSSSSLSWSTCRSWKYDVFLSFRGDDVRLTFAGHLFSALVRHGIVTYKDDVTLDRGDTIRPALESGIRESNIALIIFSESYADSSWCLDELLYINTKDNGQIILPIFYHVKPSDVKEQKGKFGEAFAELEKSKDKKKVESWKDALFNAGEIAGWEPKGRQEPEFIEEIVGSILDKLSSLDSTVTDEKLAGMESRLEDLESKLRIGSGGVRMVGIWGVGGGGKTTLATSLYMKFSADFNGCCFVEKIREESKQHGLKSLQEKILSKVFNKKMEVESVDIGKHRIKSMLCRRSVLIVLDDVDEVKQLEALAGSRDWFGNGSRIIITTRDEQVLTSHRVDGVCPISLLTHKEASWLFKRHAYQEHNPVEDYEKLSLKVIYYVKGLPLAIKILGAFLYGRNKDEWTSTLARLRDHPEMGIVETLKISYDGLKHVEKELFLDIACFHRGSSEYYATRILDACGLYPAIGVKVLIEKTLITVKDDKFDMHDLVQEMGHYIVRGEHPKNPEKHSRIWRNEDIQHICSSNATTINKKIEAIHCDASGCNLLNFNMLVSNMKKLRLLYVSTLWFEEGLQVNFLSNELRYIKWDGYPASLFPVSFQPMKLLVLRMRYSRQLKELWKGYKYLPCLKEIELCGMEALVRTPDIGGFPCLQMLTLESCENLEEIQSLENHSSLVHIFVDYCDKLTRFPTTLKMDKLKTLYIYHCKAFIEFPKIEAKMDSLVRLSLKHVGIEVLPSSVGKYCTNLTYLELNGCSRLKCIEGNFCDLKRLKYFELSYCEQLEKLPKDLFNENLDGLGLKLDSISLKQLIPAVPRFLIKLCLRDSKLKDGDIPTEIGELSNLRELELFGSFTRLHFSLSRLTRLKLLILDRCEKLVELPELPSSLAILKANWCNSLEVIKDDAYKRCEWLCSVSILEMRKNIFGGTRLLESMLQGKTVESRCMTLQLSGSEISRGFERFLVRGGRCRKQLPENWYNHFSGFLFCVVVDKVLYTLPTVTTCMKHEKLIGDSENYVYWEEEKKWNRTWVGYIPFGSLINTSWWDQTSNAIEIQFASSKSTISACGCKLIPKRSEKTSSITDSSSSSDDVSNDNYTCKLKILHDSGSIFKFKIDNLSSCNDDDDDDDPFND